MDKQAHPLWNVGWNYLSILKLQRYSRGTGTILQSAQIPVKQSWTIWVNRCHESTGKSPHNNKTKPWWRHQMETFSALLAICAGNSPVPGEFPAQRPVTRSFDVFFDLRLNQWLSKQSWSWWFETLPRPLWRHCKAQENRVHILWDILYKVTHHTTRPRLTHLHNVVNHHTACGVGDTVHWSRQTSCGHRDNLEAECLDIISPPVLKISCFDNTLLHNNEYQR